MQTNLLMLIERTSSSKTEMMNKSADNSFWIRGKLALQSNLIVIHRFAMKVFEFVRMASSFIVKNLKAIKINLGTISIKSLFNFKFYFGPHYHFGSPCSCKQKDNRPPGPEGRPRSVSA